MIDVQIAPQGVREALKLIKDIEPETYKTLQKELKTTMKSLGQQIVSGIPAEAPLSGMASNGRLRWQTPRVRGTFTPSKIKKGKGVHPLLGIVVDGGAGFAMAELAGSRQHRAKPRSASYGNRWGGIQTHANNGRGQNMILMLALRYGWARGGRFAFSRFVSLYGTIGKDAEKIILDVIADFNKKFGN